MDDVVSSPRSPSGAGQESPFFPVLAQRPPRHVAIVDSDKASCLDLHPLAGNIRPPLTFYGVQVLVGAREQLLRDHTCASVSLTDGPKAQTDHADIDVHRTPGETAVFYGPIVFRHRVAEALGNGARSHIV